MTTTETNLIFLPGATGDGSFWQGVGTRLPAAWTKRYLDWPGLGTQAKSPTVNSLADLLSLAERELTQPSAIVAQSMGGIIAIQLALKHPELVTHLVLVATSGGMDVSAFGASDWRPQFLAAFPDTAPWILTERADLSDQFAKLNVPTLLIWGHRDTISPVAVGRHLSDRIPKSRLIIVPGGEHSMGMDLPATLAPEIGAFLTESKQPDRP
ncbi:MAG: alpha/beta fold hydrolase [Proteobacteria bacterium]|nr:alpha/beta fold hydrolase [Pseudomonadota bacterium]